LTIGSPEAGATSGIHFELSGSRVEYRTNTPAVRARASSEARAGTMTPGAIRLAFADTIDHVEHQQRRCRGLKDDFDRVGKGRHLQCQQ
jgi:hypothetical protein